MNINFILNDYVLAWNLLFRSSISSDIHELKQRLWTNYKKEYGKIENDNVKLLKDEKNFIPDDDTLYQLVIDSSVFDTLRKETEKYRLSLMNFWDKYKKIIRDELKKVLRFDIKSDYNVIVIHPFLEVVEYLDKSKTSNIVWGKRLQEGNELQVLLDLIYYVIKCEIGLFQRSYPEIVNAILELAIKNEVSTQVHGVSTYIKGDTSLRFLKRQIYPYWLQYLGATREEMLNYMMRDKIAFDVDKYEFDPELSKMDFYQFTEYCIRNQRQIIKMRNVEEA